MNIVFLLLCVSACSLLYASHTHQGLLPRPLAAQPWRAIGCALLALSLMSALQCFSTITAICTWLATILLSFSLLPFASLLIKKNQREAKP